MERKFGFDLLAEQIGDSARARAEFYCAGNVSLKNGSPIENLLFTAIFLCVVERIIDAEYRDPSEAGSSDLIFRAQVDIEGVGRVDFLFQQLVDENTIRSLIVECDGHDFHERTKEQATRDKARDRAAVLLGYQVFRFTGTEIWQNPLGCVQLIKEWASGKNGAH